MVDVEFPVTDIGNLVIVLVEKAQPVRSESCELIKDFHTVNLCSLANLHTVYRNTVVISIQHTGLDVGNSLSVKEGLIGGATRFPLKKA